MDLRSGGKPKGVPPESYDRFLRRKWLFLLALAAALVILALTAMTTGSSGLSLREVLAALAGRGSEQTRAIVWNVRMPRIAAAAAVGAALALSGCVMQNVLRNPLASASTLGVSQGAAFGAALGIVVFGGGMVSSASATSSIAIRNPYIVTLCAFFFGSLSTLVILAISRWKRDMGPGALVLAGVALSSLFGGGSTLLQYFTDETKLGAIVFWTFGNLGSANWQELSLLAVLLLATFVFSSCIAGITTPWLAAPRWPKVWVSRPGRCCCPVCASVPCCRRWPCPLWASSALWA